MDEVPELVELLAKVEPNTDRAFFIWNDRGDLHYGWFGMTPAEAVLYLRTTIQNIEGGGSSVETDAPRPLKH